MSSEDKIKWFKETLLPMFSSYEIKYRFFDNGDFGSLTQIEFNSDKLGGNIDFWGLGWLGIFVWDYNAEKELINVLLEPQEENEMRIEFEISEVNLMAKGFLYYASSGQNGVPPIICPWL